MGYKNFDLAIYCHVNNLNTFKDLGMDKLENALNFFEKYLKISKVYLETFRSNETIERSEMLKIKEFFNKRGIKTSGGITTANEERIGKTFESLCYTSDSDRKKLKAIVEETAELFDEIILDDFYFTNCKCESCINAKGERSWEEFRLDLMKQVSDELIIKPAKAVNPNVNVIIKYPNWYENYQEAGYNLEEEPKQFDMIYTGTETRDPQNSQQHLPRYLSYFIMRYLENVKPGKNGGGWFDPFGCTFNLGSYVEQARLTLLGKAKEVMLFCFGALLQEDFSIFIPLVGHVFNALDEYLDKLGNPIGISTYIPYHSSGEDYLHNYIGMLGIPIEPYPEFPWESKDIFLTENAVKDEEIVDKIHRKLLKGGNVIVTSGFVKVLQDKGFKRLANLKYSGRKALISEYDIFKEGIYLAGCHNAKKPILLSQLEHSTNDIWELIAGMANENNFPILLKTPYGKGFLYILNIPDDFGDLYSYPKEVLNVIRKVFSENMPVVLEAESKVGLFVYDNETFVVESFLPISQDIKVVIKKPNVVLQSLSTGEEINGVSEKGCTIFDLNISPLSCKAFIII